MVSSRQVNRSYKLWAKICCLFYITLSTSVHSKIDLSSSIQDIAKLLFDDIDTDSDSQLTFTEIKSWTSQEYNRTYEFQLNKQFANLDENNDTFLSWNEYLKRSYFLDSEGRLDIQHYANHLNDVKRSIANDKIRFERAATFNSQLQHSDSSSSSTTPHGKSPSGAGSLDFHRFRMFSMPELFPQMHAVIVETTMRNLDLNGDGVLSVDEYITAISRSREQDRDSDASSFREDDSRREYEYFFSHRDENKDGLMDYDEVLNWVLPETEFLGVEEAGHLMSIFDKNEDSSFTIDEVLQEPETFVRLAAPLVYLQFKKPPPEKKPQDEDSETVEKDPLEEVGDDSVAEELDFDPSSDHIEL